MLLLLLYDHAYRGARSDESLTRNEDSSERRGPSRVAAFFESSSGRDMLKLKSEDIG